MFSFAIPLTLILAAILIGLSIGYYKSPKLIKKFLKVVLIALGVLIFVLGTAGVAFEISLVIPEFGFKFVPILIIFAVLALGLLLMRPLPKRTRLILVAITLPFVGLATIPIDSVRTEKTSDVGPLKQSMEISPLLPGFGCFDDGIVDSRYERHSLILGAGRQEMQEAREVTRTCAPKTHRLYVL